jgi:hypothetical protein
MTLNGAGLTLELPTGWFGRIFTETEGSNSCTTLQASTAEIPSWEESTTLEMTRQNFGPGDACLVLFESPPRPRLDAVYEQAVLPIALSPSHYMPSWQGVPYWQAAFVRCVRVNGRYFQMHAFFGSQPTMPQLKLLNQILGTLQVGAPITA